MEFLYDKINTNIEKKTLIVCQSDEFLSIYINSLKDKNILVVANTLYEANKIYDSISNYNNDVLFFPTDEFISEEIYATSPELKVTRLETLNKIVQTNSKKIVITSLTGLLRILPTKENWKNSILNLKLNQDINKDDLINHLFEIGYEVDSFVKKTGDIAKRGFILDIFPCLEENPIRLEFFGDQIESIREFDIDNQLSIKELDEITIYPMSEFISKNKDAKKQQKYLKNYEKTASILDYLENSILVYKDINQIITSYNKLEEDIFNYSKEIKENEEANYIHDLYKISANKEVHISSLDNIGSKDYDLTITLDVKNQYNYEENIELLNLDISQYIKQEKTVIIALSSKKQILNIKDIIKDKSIITDESNIKENTINLLEKKINDGFIYENYVVFSEKNILKAKSTKSKYASKFKYGTKINDINKLNFGDYVVHESHGIGIYSGIVTLEKGGVLKDYILVKYKNNENLYIPVEKIDLITKFQESQGTKPKINSLGGTDWQKTKLRVRNKINDIAQKLIKVSAERKLQEGFSFSKDTEDQTEFEKEFIYEETKDQLLSTKQIKDDMELPYPMDRILCGDVGYGKTEVAFRAIFKAISNNKQVAYLCPTTLLSKQQYNSALERFKNYPVSIALLNRFTTKKELNKILEDLVKGKIDILFGTHRLLSKDVKFKSLGLLIIDEEQRFGVTHKEKIKEYKSNIDVLTLSATPIPRTLQMAMVGLRGLSLIETPPINRYPVQTYVLEENPLIIKEAIYKEMSRGGQVYILFNNVEKIESKVKEIEKLVPDSKITFAHGKMNKNEIENIMIDFIDKKYDILVCTTIIETGIDIPNVNTLIIIDSDKFGLSQLYQIRGRVGRTNKIAYAYLMYDKKKILSEMATKRLKTIKEFTELGSGLSIAIRDLSIRGSGDILGSEQSGFIDTVGIELYTRMINEEVEKIKGTYKEKLEKDQTPLINIDTHIEDTYVLDDNIKIEIHKKINEIDSYEKLLEIKEEIEDRFGKVSDNLTLYMYQEWFEKLARDKGIEKVNQNKNSIDLLFTREKTETLNINDLYYEAQFINKKFRFSYEYKRLKVTLDTFKLDKHFLFYALEFLNIVDK